MNRRYIEDKSGLSMVVFALGLAALLGFAALAIDLGISNNIQNELQKITTTAALVGALEMEPDNNGNIDELAARQAALDAFNTGIASIPMLSAAVIVNPVGGATTTTNPNFIQSISSSRAIRIQTRAQVPTFFMAVIGIRSLQVNAQSAAISCPAYPQINLPPPSGSIVSSDIRDAIGNNSNVFMGTAPNQAAFILGSPDNVPVALGPGGSVELRMPAPIVDGPGPDIYVKETGDLEGYYIYAGIDNNDDNIADELVNISCTGIPSENAMQVTTDSTAAGAYADNNNHYKFYGSGLFDLGVTCTGNPAGATKYNASVRNATNIIIIDDGEESGILSSDLYTPVALLGEHSSTSPGADIDSIAVLHHSRTIDFNAPDTDGDGLVDDYEFLIGTNENNNDTDADTIVDGDEISGANGFVTNPRVADTDGDGVNDGQEITNGTNPLYASMNTADVNDEFDDGI